MFLKLKKVFITKLLIFKGSPLFLLFVYLEFFFFYISTRQPNLELDEAKSNKNSALNGKWKNIQNTQL